MRIFGIDPGLSGALAKLDEKKIYEVIDLNKENSEKIMEILSALEELDDVQNIFINANLESAQI